MPSHRRRRPGRRPGRVLRHADYDRQVASIGDAHQDVRFCRAPDGTRIAYAVHGSGPPLVITTCWLSHLQHDWQSPVWRHFLTDLGRVATVIRYDERGHGLSDRDVEDFSLEARIGDLEAVIEHSGIDRFAVMAMSQGGPVAIRYVADHADRVTRVIFYGVLRRRDARPLGRGPARWRRRSTGSSRSAGRGPPRSSAGSSRP